MLKGKTVRMSIAEKYVANAKLKENVLREWLCRPHLQRLCLSIALIH